MMFIKIYFQTFRPHQNSQGKTLILKYIFGRFLNMQQQNTACTAPVKKCFRNGRLYFLYFALWLPKFGWVNLWVKVYQLFNRKIYIAEQRRPYFLLTKTVYWLNLVHFAGINIHLKLKIA